ncbi:MAG: hypothetical protein LQ338_006080 [Usnochroma carphineum]|nr:MAG: hypothetical protein LQ338_006080 [Usnochroma carphineum]
MSRLQLETSEPPSSPWEDEQNERPARPKAKKPPVIPNKAKKVPTQKTTESQASTDHNLMELEALSELQAAKIGKDAAGPTRDGDRLRALVDSLCAKVEAFRSLIQAPPMKSLAHVPSQDHFDTFVSILEDFCSVVKTETSRQRTSTAATKSLTENIDQLKADNQRLRTERNSYRLEAAKLRTEASDTSDKHDDRVKELIGECPALRKERDHLQAEKTILEQRTVNVEQTHQAATEEKGRLAAEITLLKSHVSGLEEDVNKYESTEGRYQEKYKRLKKRKAEDDGQRDLLESQNSEHHTRTKQAHDSLGGKTKELQDKNIYLATQNRELVSRNQDLESKLPILQDKAQRLEASCNSLEADLQTSREDISELKKRNTDLAEKYRVSRDEAKALAAANQKSQEHLTRLKHDLQDQKMELQESNAELSKATLRATRLLNDVTQITIELNNCKEKRDTLSRTNKKLQVIIRDERAQRKSREAELETCDVTCHALRDFCTQKDGQLDNCAQTEEILRQIINSQRKDISEYKREQHSLTTRFEAANCEIARLRAEAASTEAEVARLKAQTNQAEARANKRVAALQTQIDLEKYQVLFELRTLLVTQCPPWATFRRLRIPSDVIWPRKSTSYSGCLHARSIIRGQRFTAFSPSGKYANHRVLKTTDWTGFSNAICHGMINIELCINRNEAKDRCIDLLWDIWGNLGNTTMSHLQMSGIATPLAHILRRVIASCSEGKLPSLAFWLASQLVSYLLQWDFADLHIQAPDLPWPAKPDDATLVAAGYSCIKQGDKGLDLNQGETLNFFDSVFGTAERFPDNCLRFLQS